MACGIPLVLFFITLSNVKGNELYSDQLYVTVEEGGFCPSIIKKKGYFFLFLKITSQYLFTVECVKLNN